MELNEKKLIIFDLDGTLNDSRKGFAYCYRETAKTYGIDELTDEDLKEGFSGPFEIGIAKILHITEEEVPEAVARYVDFYQRDGRNMACLFPGVKEVVRYLKNKGYALAVATMMEEGFANDTLRNNGIDDCFAVVRGASFTIPYRKDELITKCLYDTGIGPEDAVMIGDGVDDHNASKMCGIDFIGVTYGYDIDTEYCESESIPYITDPSQLKEMF